MGTTPYTQCVVCNLVCYDGFELANSLKLQLFGTNGLVWFQTISLVETTASNHCRFETNGGAVSNVSVLNPV